MTNINTTRFDTAYEYIRTHDAPIDLTHTLLGTDSHNMQVSVDVAEGVHIDDDKRSTSRGIGLLITQNAGLIIDRVGLYRDAEGDVIATYSGRADLYGPFSTVNHGYPETEFKAPEEHAEIALNSAFVAVESALAQHVTHSSLE